MKKEGNVVVKNVYKTGENLERIEQVKKLLLKGIERNIKIRKMM